MKIKTHIFLAGVIVALSFTSSFGQLSLGVEVGSPTGSFADAAAAGFGVSAGYDGVISGPVHWTAMVGFLSFAGKQYMSGNMQGKYESTSIVPIAAGAKYYFSTSGSGLYGSADLSTNIINYSVAVPNNGKGKGVTFKDASTSNFGISPGVGYKIGALDVTLRYNLVTDFNYVGIRVAYVLGLLGTP
jgi:hypothetical protein